MKSSKQVNKRSGSPLIPKTIEISERKKKYSNPLSKPVGKAIKEFDTYGKPEHKKNNANYLNQVLRNESGNKYRIVTEPVEDRIMHLVSSSFGKISRSKTKVDNYLLSQPVKFNLRSSSQSKEKFRKDIDSCKNCQRLTEELQYMKNSLEKLWNLKIQWKKGQIYLDSIEHQLTSPKKLDKYSSGRRPIQNTLFMVRNHIFDMMKDIESLSQIDFPKMLSLDLLSYEPSFTCETVDHQEAELKSLLGQLRNSIEGKLNDWDLQDQNEESGHVKAMMRNLKCRLNHCLRQNLELKMKKAVLEKSEEMSEESQNYLKKVIEDVLMSYSVKA